MLSEREGRAVLWPRFEAAGLSLVADHRLSGEGFDIVVDGFDPARGIGFEFITGVEGDRAEFTAAVLDALEARMRAGDLHLLLLDEKDVPDAAFLARAADRFLARLRELGRLR